MEQNKSTQAENVRTAIAQCDFRASADLHPSGNWVIAVGESEWQRRIAIAELSDTDRPTEVLGKAESWENPALRILGEDQSEKAIDDVDIEDVSHGTYLDALTETGYPGVKQLLNP